MDMVEGETPDWKSYNLPLARIKKVMKSDEEVKVGFLVLYLFMLPIRHSDTMLMLLYA